jgi:hypothetical protein
MKYYSRTCRFRMSRPLFLCIMGVVEDHDDYFIHKRNAANKLRLSFYNLVTTIHVYWITIIGAGGYLEFRVSAKSSTYLVHWISKFCTNNVLPMNHCYYL